MPLELAKLPKDGEELQVWRYSDETTEAKQVTYLITAIIGHGAFGAVYKAQNVEDKSVVAIKAEPTRCRKKMLRLEFKVMRAGRSSGSPYFTEYGERSSIPNRCFFVVMQLVGQNLWDLLIAREGAGFSVHTACRVAIQTLAGIRDLHELHYLHRDIKPANFAVGRKEDDKDSTIYILDFGMCRKYRNAKGLFKERDSALYRGTNRYSSCGSLDNKDQCRKDDIESWFYMVLEFSSGNVPWNKCKGRAETLKRKREFRKPEEFDSFLEGCPVKNDLRRILKHCDEMDWYSKPDYNGLRKVLQQIMDREEFREQAPFDWSPKSIYISPEWDRGKYVKARDRYTQDSTSGGKKDTPTHTDTSSKHDDKAGSKEGSKENTVNDTVTAATTTGMTGGTTGIATGDTKKEGEEKKRKKKKTREEKKKEKSDKNAVHTEKISELKLSGKRETEKKPSKVCNTTGGGPSKSKTPSVKSNVKKGGGSIK